MWRRWSRRGILVVLILLAKHHRLSFAYNLCQQPASWIDVREYHGENSARCSFLRMSSVDEASSDPPVARYPKETKSRKKSQNRRPKFYWKDLSNVDQELRDLWQSKNVEIPSHQPPPIPNESLLNYWGRHDLRGVIATHGGRELLSESLGGALVIPGKWGEAVQIPYVQQILQHDDRLLADIPPPSPRKKPGKVHTPEHIISLEKRWSHSSNRKPLGFWSSTTVVITELYEFLEDRRASENLPAAWMPRLSQLEQSGRIDLAAAIKKFGGQQTICRKAGLVPFREWNYIEGMYEMLVRLKDYLDEYYDGDYKIFPVLTLAKERGKDRLHSLVQYYGGVRFLSARLDMEHAGKKPKDKSDIDLLSADMSWGPFDLVFAIELYAVCRDIQMKKNPPLSSPEIQIPSQIDLLKYGEKGSWLDEKIQAFGGYENVARRLGLGYSFR